MDWLELAKIGGASFVGLLAVVTGALGVVRVRNNRRARNSGKGAQAPGDPAQLVEAVTRLVGALTNDQGEPSLGCGADVAIPEQCSRRFERLDTQLDSHGKMHRKHFSALRKLSEGQTAIMDHITNGATSSHRPQPVASDIDAESTGEFLAHGYEDES